MPEYNIFSLLGDIFKYTGIITLLCYILTSITYMKIFKVFHVGNPILAWIPIVNNYVFGKVAWQTSGAIKSYFGRGVITNTKLSLYWIIYIGWYFIPIIGPWIYAYKSLNAYLTIIEFIYTRMFLDDRKLLSILSMLFPFILWFKILTFSGELHSEATDMFGDGVRVDNNINMNYANNYNYDSTNRFNNSSNSNNHYGF